jgi:hypothetical protein
MPYETWNEVVEAAALAEPEAVQMMADKLAQIDEQQDTSQVQQQVALLQGQRVYLKQVLEWARNNPDVAFDDEAYLHAVQVDANLFKAAPHLSQERRLELAADVTREELGPAEERDNASAIAQIAAARTKQAVQPPQVRVSRRQDPEDAERAEIIAEMARGRMPHTNEAALAAQERADREPRAQRMRRAVDFPER